MSAALIPGLAERLRWSRLLLHMTAADLDRKAGTIVGYVAAIEAGAIADPGVMRLNRIARALNVRLDDLVNFGEMEP